MNKKYVVEMTKNLYSNSSSFCIIILTGGYGYIPRNIERIMVAKKLNKILNKYGIKPLNIISGGYTTKRNLSEAESISPYFERNNIKVLKEEFSFDTYTNFYWLKFIIEKVKPQPKRLFFVTSDFAYPRVYRIAKEFNFKNSNFVIPQISYSIVKKLLYLTSSAPIYLLWKITKNNVFAYEKISRKILRRIPK
ncbi:MAG: YdcF family protein [Candidatus Aenigmatarchaeota archaeon]